MSARFDAFVLFAEMRTGSNHLEDSLNALSDVESHGEVFNPVFIGAHNRTALFGIDMMARAADPMPLLDAVVGRPGLSGFRFFHDHDPRVLDRVLEDRRIAKVMLRRNPLDAYVSLEIARATGQWRLTNPKMAKAGTMRFDGAAFDARLAAEGAFRARVERALQETGQTAFRIDYDEIGDLAVLNGLATFLGSADRLSAVPGRLKKQNPAEIEAKVENPEEMRAHLARLDPFEVARSTGMEPARGPSVPRFQVAASSPLIHLPVPGGPGDAVRDWLTALDGAPPREGLTQGELRPWLRGAEGFVSFAILPHPLTRAHDALGQVMAAKGPKANDVRRVLAKQHGVPLNGAAADALLGFLHALKAVLGGQSALSVAPDWATQSALLAGMAQAVLPQRLIREAEAGAELEALAARAGHAPQPLRRPGRDVLAAIVTDEIEAACRDTYRRDYQAFGFGSWRAG
ncbi:MAG: nodulation protein NodH [Pseudomonadota bacterium]